MKNIRFKIITLLMLLLLSPRIWGQDVAIKTNILSDAFLNPNLGVEVGLAPKWTLELEGEANLWTLSKGKRWKHWAVQTEARYWFCEKFMNHFIGLHLHGGQYNIGGINGWYHLFGTDERKLKDERYQGWFIGAGISYGYDFILSKHWNLEGEIGIGWSYTKYDTYPKCSVCGSKIQSNKSHNYVGPTLLAINFVYLF